MHVDSPAKSSGNSDRGLIKKLKGFDGLAMSIGNENGISHRYSNIIYFIRSKIIKD